MGSKQQGNGEISLIGTSTVIEGKVKSEGNLRIDGKIIGEVAVQANVAVGQTGIVEGSVNGKNITMAGKISGTVVATEKLVLEAKSVLQGDIKAAKLVVDEGAMFDGQCAMTTEKPPISPKDVPHRKS